MILITRKYELSMSFGYCKRVVALTLSLCLTCASQALAQQSAEGQMGLAPDVIESVLSGDAIVIMRHALAPGVSDPEIFDEDDCSTQRNLSEQGRDQAKRTGDELRRMGVEKADVFSSVWCRCVDTGELLGFGQVNVLESLNSFFVLRETEPARTGDTRLWIQQRIASNNQTPVILVSHSVNITALTGAYVSSGEALVITTDGDAINVLGSFLVDP